MATFLRQVCWGSLVLAACSNDRLMALPEGGRAWIVAMHEHGTTTVAAVDAEAISFLPSEDEYVLEAYGYDGTLEQLGLEEGLLPFGEDCSRQCAIMTPVSAYDAGTASEWLERDTAALSDSLADELFPTRRCDPKCFGYAFEKVSIPGIAPTGRLSFAATIRSDAWMVQGPIGADALHSSPVFEVTSAGQVTKVCDGLPGPILTRTEDGMLYAADGDRVAVLDPITCTRTATVPGVAGVQTLWVTETEPKEIYAAVDSGLGVDRRVEVFHGRFGDELVSIGKIPSDDPGGWGVSTDPRKNIYFTETDSIGWVEGDRLVVEQSGFSNARGIVGAYYDSERGPVLSASKLGLLIRPGDPAFGASSAQWSVLSGEDVYDKPRGFAVLSDRIVALSRGGTLQQWPDGRDECVVDVAPIPSNVAPRFLRWLPDGTMLAADADLPTDVGQDVVIIRLKAPPDVCASKP